MFPRFPFVIPLAMVLVVLLAHHSLGATDDLPLNPLGSNDDGAELTSSSPRYYAFEYQQQLLRSVAPLYKSALQKHFIISDEAIEQRLAHYKQAFPKQSINRKLLMDELQIEQFVRTEYNFIPSDHAMDKLFQTLQAQARPHVLNRESLRPLLNAHGLLTHPEVARYCAELTASALAAAMQQNAADNKPWPAEQIHIPGDGSECIARAPNQNSCLITIAQLNSMLDIAKPSHKTPLDSARAEVLRLLLQNCFYAQKAAQEGFGKGAETEERIEEMITMNQLTARLRQFGPPVTDEDYLYYIYDKYYHHLFSRKTTLSVYLWGSSDSTAIQELHATLSPRSRSSTRPSANAPLTSSSIQAVGPICLDSLPPAFSSACDTLAPGELSQPLHTPYGSFIVRMDSVAVRRGISFHDAKFRLTYLATRERWINPDSICSARAQAFFTAHAEQYRTPDTLFVRSWLTTHEKASTLSLPDTARTAPRRLRSTDLPTTIRLSLEQAVKADGSVKKRAHFLSALGTWFCLIDSIHPGGKAMDFEQVEETLIEQVRQSEFSETDFEPAHSDSVRLAVYHQHASSQLYQAELWERIQLQTQSEHHSSSAKDSDERTAEDTALEKLLNDFNQWCTTLSINEQVLYRTSTIPNTTTSSR